MDTRTRTPVRRYRRRILAPASLDSSHAAYISRRTGSRRRVLVTLTCDGSGPWLSITVARGYLRRHVIIASPSRSWPLPAFQVRRLLRCL
ncbi:hypothetical protein [Streptosporangium sp. NPDC051022]|uniref:hypothetical protein n=1 Tax=Streptosporangium sp. NPDC051022 TaxID=3155752 RepID=UPI00342BAED1